MRTVARTIILLVTLTQSTAYAATTLTGNATEPGQTFLFRVQQHVQSLEYPLDQAPTEVIKIGLNFYTGAHPSDGGAGNVNQFAVAQVTRGSTQFIGVTPQQVTLNKTPGAANPLYDSGIAFMQLLDGSSTALSGSVVLPGNSERPVVVSANDLTTIYMINNFAFDGSNVKIVSAYDKGTTSHNIPDANGAVTGGIQSLCVQGPSVYAVVAPHTGVFGDAGTGVAVCQVGALEESNLAGFYVLDAQTFQANQTPNHALPFDITSSFITIGSNLASMNNVADCTYHTQLDRLYIALQTTANSGASDGARSIFMARITPITLPSGKASRSLVFDPIAPTTVFDGSTTQIVGAVGAGAVVSANKVRSMYTSTALPYLIVQGNVGTPSATTQSVFALPLVSGISDADVVGSIASTDAAVVPIYSSAKEFGANSMQTAATTAAQMPHSTDAATRVGGGDITNGSITDVLIDGDAVFVTVQIATGSQVTGVFHSQALFDDQGKIIGWTYWKQVAGTTDPVFGIGLDPNTANFYTMVAEAGQVNTVKRTIWSEGVTLLPLSETVQTLLPQNQGGVQGLFDFVITSTAVPSTTPGLFDISLLVATGSNGIMLAQTSSYQAGVVAPTSSFNSVINFQDGTIDQTMPVSNTNFITITGGALANLGPIASAEIGVTGSNGYLFVGGTKGVAVLSNPDGSGWNTATGLGVGLVGLTAGMTFKQIQYPYTLVRKLVYDNGYLYVLTNSLFHRIDLSATNVGLGVVEPVVLAQPGQMPGVSSVGSFLDCIISHQVAFLATSQGLLTNSAAIATASNIDAVGWQQLPTPEGDYAVRQLLAISATGRAQDISSQQNGYVFALSASQGNDQAYAYRYAVQNTQTGSLTNQTVQQIPDMFVQDVPSYFLGFGQFRNIFYSDGSLYFATRSKTPYFDPMVVTLNSTLGIKTGSAFPTTVLTPTGVQGSIIAAFLRNSASGSWIVAGDGGLRINE